MASLKVWIIVTQHFSSVRFISLNLSKSTEGATEKKIKFTEIGIKDFIIHFLLEFKTLDAKTAWPSAVDKKIAV